MELFLKETTLGLLLDTKSRSPVHITKEEELINFAALRALARVTKLDGAKLVIYRPALLKIDDFSIYNSEDYEDFFEVLQAYCQANDIPFRAFDNAIPDSEFGMTNSGLPDFFHFNGKGHNLLGKAVDSWMMELGD